MVPMGQDSNIRVVLITCPAGEVAARVARSVVEARLAACVNIVPGVRSIYRWQGEVCDEREDLLVVKTSAARLDDLIAHVRDVHPYSVPEVLALVVPTGNPSYLNWVLSETQE